jgi:kynurenine formamidase
VSERETYRTVGERLRAWGRWGADDEIGAANLVTPERIVAAARLVTRGAVFDLGIPLDADGPQVGDFRPNPVHVMTLTGEGQDFPGGMHFSDDTIFMGLQSATQWDSLAHVYYDDTLYNGQPSSTITASGASRNSIDKMSRRLVGRGVLLDIARLKGVEHLQLGEEITPDDLDAAVAAQGVTVEPGDILLVRTGWRAMFTRTRSPEQFMAGEPGLALECADWIAQHEISAVASDNWAVEVIPSPNGDSLPLHLVLIRDMGVTLGEMFDLEALAADCAEDGRWAFLLSAAPMKVTAAVGSPISPVAIK